MHFRNHPMSHNPNFLIIRTETDKSTYLTFMTSKAPVPGWYNSPRKASAQHSQSLVKQLQRVDFRNKQFQLPMFVAYMSGFMMLDPSHPNSELVISLVWSCPNPRFDLSDLIGSPLVPPTRTRRDSLGAKGTNRHRAIMRSKANKINPIHRFPDRLTEQTSSAYSKFAPKGKDGCEGKIQNPHILGICTLNLS